MARVAFQSRADFAGRMMFWRLLWRLLRGSQGRLAVALIALISGAAVVSALLNLDLDIERKLTQEFRSLGANLVISSGRAPQAAERPLAQNIHRTWPRTNIDGCECRTRPDRKLANERCTGSRAVSLRCRKCG